MRAGGAPGPGATPLVSAVEEYLAKGRARFHMPGHKGVAAPPLGAVYRYDITEVPGADSLYEADGPIAATEAAYSRLYGTAGTLLSAGGSTLCIQAMLALAAGRAQPRGAAGAEIICARGVHTAALNAMALLDLRPVWVYPGADPLTGLCGPVTAEQVRAALEAHPEALAVYLTSPSYYGVLSDVAAVAAVCRARSVPLLVDNAHGAHLRFLPGGGRAGSLHPADLGADLCCDSLHKTLPVLTGGALLQIADPAFIPDARRRMSLFGSTSPSYPILLSADAVLPYLEEGARADLARVSGVMGELGALAVRRGFLLPGEPRDPVRLTLGFAPLGMDGAAFREHLAACGVEPELCGDSYCVFLAGGANSGEDFARLRRAIERAPRLPGRRKRPPEEERAFAPPQTALTLREAVFAPCEAVAVGGAEGRIAACAAAPCPPGIPLAVPGEILDKYLLRTLKRYGILSINVIK